MDLSVRSDKSVFDSFVKSLELPGDSKNGREKLVNSLPYLVAIASIECFGEVDEEES